MKLTEEQLVAIIGEHRAQSLGADNGELSAERATALDRYHGRPYGTEIEGRSAIVSKDLSEAVDWAMPAIMRVFTQSGNVAELDPVGPEDEQQAEIETCYVNQVIMRDNNGWMILHDAIKDALLLKNGYVKHWWEEAEKIEEVEYEGLTLQELQQMMAELQQDGCEVEIKGQEERQIVTQTGPLSVFDIELKVKRKHGAVKIEAVPSEEVRVSRRCRGSLQESPFVEHVTHKTRSDLLEMGMDKAFVDDLPAYSQTNNGTQAFSRDSVSDESQVQGYGHSMGDRSMDEVEYCEAYIRVDCDGDGVAELRKIVTVGNKIPPGKDWNESIPEVALTGFVCKRVPHRHIGESLYDDLGDLQEIKTVLLRQLFDNIYATNNNQWAVNERVNLADFMTSLPGGIKRIEGIEPVNGSFEAIQTVPIAQNILPIIDYVDGIKENRTGINKAASGMDPDVLQNVTKGAFMENANRASQKIEMITRLVAESGVKELVLRVHSLLCRYQDKQRMIRMKGKFVPVNPQGWRERTDVTVNVGLGTGNQEDKQQKLIAISQMQQAVLAPLGMIGPKQAFAMFTDSAKAMGFDNPDKYAMSPDSPEFQQKMQNPPPNPQIQIEQAKMQGAQQIEQIKAQLADQQHQREIQMNLQLEQGKQEMQARDTQHTVQVAAQRDMQKAQLDAQLSQQRMEFDRWKAELDASVKIQVAQISAKTAIDAASLAAQQSAAAEVSEDLNGSL